MAEGGFREIAAGYDINGYQRIYLVHIRKTGGTSLNDMFLSLSGQDSAALYRQLAETPDHRLLVNGLIYVGWNVRHINRGNYYYGFSHEPLHKLDLPARTFTLSCFRDPVKRVVSHYNMLMDYRVNNIDHPCMAVEGKWLGDSFDEFLRRVPRQHLQNQLYMFSGRYDVDEALDNVRRLSCCFFTEEFADGVRELNRRTGLNLEPKHIRRAGFHAEIPAAGLARLGEMLREEYRFLEQVRLLPNAGAMPAAAR